MNNIFQQANELNSGLDHKNLKIPVHLDHKNPTRFEVDDLKKLIKQVSNTLIYNKFHSREVVQFLLL